jgi:ABC-type glycerol-3-phosphate transport system permease component
VQTAIATVAIVTTLGLWNLFATPSKVVKTAETSEPVLPPPTEPPVDVESIPTAMPQVKIIFTPGVTPTTVVQQQVQQAQQPAKKKKKKNNDNNNNSGGSVSVTQTKTS